MTDMTIKIVLKGLALCYHKNGQWKAILPFDRFHRLLFSCEKNGVSMQRPISLAEKRSVSLTATNARPASMPSQPNFKDFIDITAKYAHDKGITVKDGWNDRSVLMTFSEAVFAAKAHTNKEFLAVKPGLTYAIDLKKVGLTSEAEITLQDGGSLVIAADGEELATIAYEAGANYAIIFDNDCPEEEKEPRNDFVVYYNVIEDAIDPALKLDILAKVTKGEVEADPKILEKLAAFFNPGCETCICANITASQMENLP